MTQHKRTFRPKSEMAPKVLMAKALAVLLLQLSCGLQSPLQGDAWTSSSVLSTQTHSTSTQTEADSDAGSTSSSTPSSSSTSTSTSTTSATTDYGVALRWMKNPNLCVATSGATPAAGAGLVLAPCANVLRQRFIFFGSGSFASAYGPFCVEVQTSGQSPAAPILAPCSASSSTTSWILSEDNTITTNVNCGSGSYYRLTFTAATNGTYLGAFEPAQNALQAMSQFWLDASVVGSTGFMISTSANQKTQCLSTSSGNINVLPCNTNDPTQRFNLHNGVLYQANTCLTCLANAQVAMVSCSAASTQTLPLNTWFLAYDNVLVNWQCGDYASIIVSSGGLSMTQYFSNTWNFAYPN